MNNLFMRICAAILAVCLCLSTGGCATQEAPSSSETSTPQSSSVPPDSQPDLVGSSQAPLSEAQTSISAPTIAIENRTEEDIQKKMVTPQFSGFAGADELNAKIAAEQQDTLANLQAIAEENRSAGQVSTLFYQSVFDYQDNGLLSVWLTNETYTGGAHGTSWVSSYNVNPETGKFYEFRDLFREPEEAIPEITDQILSHLKNILTDESLYETASEAVRALNGDYSYYLDGENLVVYFQPYDVAPYALGIVRVPVALSSLPDMTVALRAAPARRTIRVNGQDTDLNRNMMIGSGGDTTVLLPVPETARLCGVQATVKNQACLIDGKEYPVTYANGGAFMTLSDFLAIAPNDSNHLVVYGADDILRIYTAEP